jgi:16S rRNA (cytidine1402-2'-O)-methyltransferase
MKGEKKGGVLFIVSTPIGNLGDFTHRAVEVLREADLIAAEDTRRTRILLNHYGIRSRLSSFNSYNQVHKGRQFIDRIHQGETLALVSDAGTPGVSDPLYHLVRLAIEEEIPVQSIPGPSALLCALTLSGLPMDRFVFEGFLPRKKRRKTHLEELAKEKRTIVIFESPHRIEKTLRDLYAHFGNRNVALARELTKMHEEIIRGNLEELVSQAGEKTWRGEITLVIGGNEEKQGGRRPETEDQKFKYPSPLEGGEF